MISGKKQLRVLVADDSPTARAVLTGMLTSDGRIEVVGYARTGMEAIHMAAELRPDLITMDVQMPEVDGLQATREIMATTPTPIMIISSTARDDATLSLNATEAGALMVVPRPVGPLAPNYEEEREYLLRMVHAMAAVRVVRRWRSSSRPPANAALPPKHTRVKPRVVAIAASTGGPAAIRQILHQLPVRFPLPILIVQHLARGFVPSLVDWLKSETRLDVTLAQPAQELTGGCVYIAPDDRHLEVTPLMEVRLTDTPRVGQFKPSANRLFESIASSLGGAAIGVVLTGMGDDGVQGMRSLHRAGGFVIAQDRNSSIIYGMAREAVHAGVVDEVLDLDSIASRLVELSSPDHG